MLNKCLFCDNSTVLTALNNKMRSCDHYIAHYTGGVVFQSHYLKL